MHPPEMTLLATTKQQMTVAATTTIRRRQQNTSLNRIRRQGLTHTAPKDRERGYLRRREYKYIIIIRRREADPRNEPSPGNDLRGPGVKRGCGLELFTEDLDDDGCRTPVSERKSCEPLPGNVSQKRGREERGGEEGEREAFEESHRKLVQFARMRQMLQKGHTVERSLSKKQEPTMSSFGTPP